MSLNTQNINKKYKEKQCSHCGETFQANRSTAKFCGSSCRSQFWLNKNKKKMLTISVPQNIDEAFFFELNSLIEKYENLAKQKEVATNKGLVIANTQAEAYNYLYSIGIKDFRLPHINNGVYYSEGLSIKKIDDQFEIKTGI